MITVKLVGVAKKSFLTEQMRIDRSGMSVSDLLDLLSELKPADTPELDTDNILVAVNGADSSAMEGRLTMIGDNDLVSIIPVIHGGSAKRLTLQILKKQIQVLEIAGQKATGVRFLDGLRERHPKVRLQAVSQNFILNGYHLKKILYLSLESERRDVLLSNRLETDILMRFALTPQISDAISDAGIKPNANFVLIAVGGKGSLDSLYGDLLPRSVCLFSKDNCRFLKRHFKITKKQLGSVHSTRQLEDILAEKAAVLL